MGVYSLVVSLVASDPNASYTRSELTRDDFLVPLGADESDELIVDLKEGGAVFQTSYITFFSAAESDFSQADEATEAFHAAVQNRLSRVAAWLNEREAVLKQLGEKLNIVWMFEFFIEQDIIDLTLPPEFLEACGRCKTPIQIMSEGM